MLKNKYWFPWHCPECNTTGNIFFDDNVDIWLVIQKIAENHKRTSPMCECWWSFLKSGIPDVQNTITKDA